jgi:type II secretion system protein G
MTEIRSQRSAIGSGVSRCPERQASPGFTLLELLVVVAIIGILVGIMLPAIGGVKIKAQKKKAESDVKSLAVACRAYHTEYGYWAGDNPKRGISDTYQSTDEGFMRQLTAADRPNNPRQINFIEWQKPTTTDDPGMVDPFRGKQPYRITINVTNNAVTVWSFGPDGTNGGGDDITVSN